MFRYFFFILLASVVLSSCSSPVKDEDFHGRWKYLEVSNPEQVPLHVQRGEELAHLDPSISFSPKGELVMNWGGKVLSHGTYTIEYPNIVYTEALDKGKSRVIRFLIKKFESDTLVFQTGEADPVRVKAVRVNE